MKPGKSRAFGVRSQRFRWFGVQSTERFESAAKSKRFGSAPSAPGAVERGVLEVRRSEQRGRKPELTRKAPDFVASRTDRCSRARS